jgi:hypothetical protein
MVLPGKSTEGYMLKVLSDYKWIALLVVVALAGYFGNAWFALFIGIGAAAIMLARSLYFWLHRMVVRGTA